MMVEPKKNSFIFSLEKISPTRFCRNYPALPVYDYACYIIDVVIVLELNANGLNAATIINISLRHKPNFA